MMEVMKIETLKMRMTQEWKNFSMILSQTTRSLLKAGAEHTKVKTEPGGVYGSGGGACW
jgi:hypothetical protein